MDDPNGLVWRAPMPQDAEAIGRMHHQAWVDAYAHLLPDDWFEHWTVDDSVAKWRRILAAPAPPDLTRIAVFDGTGAAVAWVVAGPSRPEDEVQPARARELWGLYVAREHHGTGLARELAERALGDAPAEVWVFEGNPRAEAFYRRNGFRDDGTELVVEHPPLVEVRMVR